jgi:hypothetical protein
MNWANYKKRKDHPAMSQIIIRLYDTIGEAAKVAKHLQDEGYEHAYHFKGETGKGAAAVAERNSLVSRLMAAQMWKSHAENYAARLAKGQSLALVHAPFSTAANAISIMDSYAPVDVGLNEAYQQKDFVFDDATPLSSLLQIPVLTNVKLPAEMMSGVSSLSKGKAFLSSLLGMSLLTQGVQHRNTSMGLPLLSRSATPLSSMFGMSTLSRNPTPLSSLFNMKVLTRRK